MLNQLVEKNSIDVIAFDLKALAQVYMAVGLTYYKSRHIEFICLTPKS